MIVLGLGTLIPHNTMNKENLHMVKFSWTFATTPLKTRKASNIVQYAQYPTKIRKPRPSF